MRYIISSLLFIFLILLPGAATAAEKREGAKKSSLSHVRKPQKYERKPLVYSAKRNRPLVAKKKRWWQKR